jgi:hypothetical protein
MAAGRDDVFRRKRVVSYDFRKDAQHLLPSADFVFAPGLLDHTSPSCQQSLSSTRNAPESLALQSSRISGRCPPQNNDCCRGRVAALTDLGFIELASLQVFLDSQIANKSRPFRKNGRHGANQSPKRITPARPETD